MATVTTNTSNKQIDYVVKDFNSTLDSIISFATVNYGSATAANRLWTNFNASSFSRTFAEIVAYTSDILYFYLDEQATQNYLQTATLRSSIKLIAQQFGFTPATAASASGNITLTFTAAGTVPRGFRLVSTTGVPFFITNPVVAGASGEYIGTALQGTLKSETFVAQGLQNEEFTLSSSDVIIDTANINPADITPALTVTGNSYSLVTSFLRFNGTDSVVVKDSLGSIIGGGGRVFTLGQRPNGSAFITFGDGIFGRKLVPGETITINYRTGGGAAGNIQANTIVTQDSLGYISSVNNVASFSGGSDEQSIEQLRELIPASLRTLDRAVSETDFSDIIITNFSEVFAASTEANTTDPGIDLNIYVVPKGQGISKISENSLLSTKISSYIDRRKMVTVQFQLLDAFSIDTLITLEINVNDTASRTTVSQAIQTSLLNFFSLTTGGTSGSGVGFAEQVLLKDIYDLVAQVDGVSRIEVKRLTYRPRIAQDVQGLLTTYNATDVSIFNNVSESEWLLAANGSTSEIEGTIVFDNSKPEDFSYETSAGKITYNFPVDLSQVAPGDTFRNGPGLTQEITVQTVGDGTGAFEVTKVTTVADQEGNKEVSKVTTIADTAGSLGGTFFLIYDIAGSVAVWFNVNSANTQPSSGANRNIQINLVTNATANTVATAVQTALNADSEFTATVSTNEVTVTCDTKATLTDTVDGAVPTNFTFVTLVQGQSPQSLSGTYYDIYDDVGVVRVWFNVDGTSTAPSSPVGGRLLSVVLVSNDPASVVATKMNTVVDTDAKFSSTVLSNVVTITASTVGTKTDASDGLLPTHFTFVITTQGAPATTIDGKYFIIYDANGSVAYWYDVDNNGTVEPAHGASRSIEITTVTSGMTANQVATQTNTAITAGIVESNSITTLADVSGSLNNKYFLLNSANNTNNYYVWYNVASAGTDPTLAGKTGIQIALSTNATANTVASTTNSAINTAASAYFTSSVLSSTVTIVNTSGGNSEGAVDSISPTQTNFTFTNIVQGTTWTSSVLANVITVDSSQKATISSPDAGTSGFTVAVVRFGVEDNTDFLIFSVDSANSILYILPNQPVNPVAGVDAGGSIRNGVTSYSSFKCYKKLRAKATNLSIDSITDTTIDLSIATGIAIAIAARTIIDNTKVFVPDQYATGIYYLIDGSGNIWEITSNTSNTITTSITAVNDAAITTVSSGAYKIVEKLIGSQVLFNGSVFNIQYNSNNTIYSIGAQFTQIGTIGDAFEISKLQSNIGNLGTAVDIIAYDNTTGTIRFNSSPDLFGISSNNVLIDSTGQTFSIVGIDNRPLPQISYDVSNQTNEFVLSGTSLGSQYAQGFKVNVTDSYAVISFNLRKEGNIVGSLIAKIVNDDGSGLPDSASVVAVSLANNVNGVSEVSSIVPFSFLNPPTLNAATQYHLIISGDTAYAASQQDGVLTFNNTGSVAYTYNSISGLISYASAVILSGVSPGNFFQDNDGTLFKIINVDDTNNTVTIGTGLTVISGINGNIIAKDNIYVAVDDSVPTYVDGELARFDGLVWSNSTQGPDPFSGAVDAIFSVEGPRSITIDSNLTPVLGTGATISSRYYDDNNEVSFVIGVASGSITSATDVNAYGKGTVSGVPNSTVDNFIFRTSRYADDIVTIRKNEIPQIQLSDIELQILGGVS